MRLTVRQCSGVVLIVVLWILVILILLAMSLGRRGSVNSALVKLGQGQLRARYIALSGLRYAVTLIDIDGKDEKGSQKDSIRECGVVLKDGLTLEQVYKHVTVPGGYFEIVNSFQRLGGRQRYGMSDEEGRLNLNAVTPSEYKVLQYLIMDAGIPDETAKTIASSVVDWIDQDDAVFNEPYGQENEPKAFVKNGSFQSLQEFLLVKGMTPAIFEAIKDDLTVFPPKSALAVNLNTASPRVLRSLLRNLTGERTNTEFSDADSLVDKIILYRKGPDGLDGTNDDKVIESQDLRLNARETALMAQLDGYRAKTSNYLRMGIRAVDDETKAEYWAEAIVARQDGAVVYWQKIK